MNKEFVRGANTRRGCTNSRKRREDVIQSLVEGFVGILGGLILKLADKSRLASYHRQLREGPSGAIRVVGCTNRRRNTEDVLDQRNSGAVRRLSWMLGMVGAHWPSFPTGKGRLSISSA